MNYNKITQNNKVVQLLMQRAEIEKEIQKLDNNALVSYELEKLSEPQADETNMKPEALYIDNVRLSLPSQNEIDEQIDFYAFRVPYDGSNNFYDDVALKHYKADIEWLLKRIKRQ
jgi:hypothetical protein